MGESEEFDAKLRKAFLDLSVKTNQTNEMLNEVERSRDIMEQNIKVAEIAIEEVGKLESNKSVFHSIGRIFVQRNKDEEIVDQKKDITSYTQRIQDLAKQKEYLTKNLADAQKNLREMVQQGRGEKA